MGIFYSFRALRAIVLVGGMACAGAPGDLIAGPLNPSAANTTEIAPQPFGLPAATISYGTVWQKWLAVEHRLEDEMVQIALCDGDRERCVSPAALRFLAVVDSGRAREGRARLGEINRAINLAIRPMSDLAQHGAIDVWSSPLSTFNSGAGDCEDYAIAKYVALRQAGIAPDDLRIVIMQDTVNGDDHAVAAARLDGRWLMLDNRRMAMVEDAYVRNYRPTFVIGQNGMMQYVAPQLLADASTGHDAAAAPDSALPATAIAALE